MNPIIGAGTMRTEMKMDGVSEAPLVPLFMSAGHAGPRPKKRRNDRSGRKGDKVSRNHRRIERIARSILKATSVEDLMRVVQACAPDYVIAKIGLVQEALKDHFTFGSFAALSRLSLSEGADLLEKDGRTKLSGEAHLALKMAFNAFTRCNARFFDAMKARALPPEVGGDLQNYAGCVVAFEMATNALALHVTGKARARLRELPNVLSGLCQSWADEMTVYATRLGLLDAPASLPSPSEPRPRDEAVDAMAEAAWARACRELRQSET